MARPAVTEYGEFYQTYINYTTVLDYESLIETHHQAIIDFWFAIPAELINYAYAPQKWTVRQVFQHVIDTERIFAYRALVISRGESTPIPGFDENEYAKNGTAENRNWDDMLKEWSLVRQSTNCLFNSFTPAQLIRLGTASNYPISVNALGFIIFGHALHHIRILKERYLLK